MFDIHAIQSAAYSVAVDGDTFRFHDANRSALALAGLTAAFLPGLTPHDVFCSETAAVIVQRYRACCDGEAVSYVTDSTIDAVPRRWQTTLFPVAGADGLPAFVYAVCSQIEDVARSVDLPALALEALDGGFWTLDLSTREFRTSRGLAEKIAGPGHHELSLAEYVSYIHVDDLRLEMPDGEHDVTVEFRVFTYDRRMRWLQTRRRPVRDGFGRSTHVVGIVLDVTDQKLSMKRLEEEAATDALTRVGNRRAFERGAERCFEAEDGQRFGVVIVDLDGFKPVNDRYGHRTGDDLLRGAGERLGGLVAPGDLLARIGGDEFAVLMPATTPDIMDALIRRIEIGFHQPFAVGGLSIAVGASCGFALRSPRDRSVGDIVARADEALYAAKKRHRHHRVIG